MAALFGVSAGSVYVFAPRSILRSELFRSLQLNASSAEKNGIEREGEGRIPHPHRSRDAAPEFFSASLIEEAPRSAIALADPG